MIKNKLEFAEFPKPRSQNDAIIPCFLCNMPLVEYEFDANVIMSSDPNEFICEKCYITLHPEEYIDY